MRCSICGNQDVKFWRSIKEYEHFICKSCKHVFISPIPSKTDLDIFYQSENYYSSAEKQITRIIADARLRLAIIKSYTQQYGLEQKLLDVGCATGIFLSEAKKEGWNATGVEISKTSAKKGRVSSQCKILVGDIENHEFRTQLETYDVITAWEVLEHTVNPENFINCLLEKLKPGGLLCVSTPCMSGLPARLMGERFPMLIPPEHLNLFSKASVSILSKKFGLTEVSFKSFSSLDGRGIASGLSRIMLGRELDSLSNRRAALLKFVGGLLVGLSKIVDYLGRGSEIEIIYRHHK